MTFCDRCGKEMTNDRNKVLAPRQYSGPGSIEKPHDMCSGCTNLVMDMFDAFLASGKKKMTDV
jgi:hypothetical protein